MYSGAVGVVVQTNSLVPSHDSRLTRRSFTSHGDWSFDPIWVIWPIKAVALLDHGINRNHVQSPGDIFRVLPWSNILRLNAVLTDRNWSHFKLPCCAETQTTHLDSCLVCLISSSSTSTTQWRSHFSFEPGQWWRVAGHTMQKPTDGEEEEDGKDECNCIPFLFSLQITSTL